MSDPFLKPTQRTPASVLFVKMHLVIWTDWRVFKKTTCPTSDVAPLPRNLQPNSQRVPVVAGEYNRRLPFLFFMKDVFEIMPFSGEDEST